MLKKRVGSIRVSLTGGPFSGLSGSHHGHMGPYHCGLSLTDKLTICGCDITCEHCRSLGRRGPIRRRRTGSYIRQVWTASESDRVTHLQPRQRILFVHALNQAGRLLSGPMRPGGDHSHTIVTIGRTGLLRGHSIVFTMVS